MKQIGTLLARVSLLTLLVAVSFFISTKTAHAANGDIVVASTKSEAVLADIGTAQIQVKCAGGAFTALGTTDAGGALVATTPAAGSNCDVGAEQLDYKVIKDGYATLTVTAVAGGWLSGAEKTLTITGLQYAYKVTAISTETIGTDITATATTVKVGDNTAQNTCTLASGAWYCPVVLANSDAAPTVYVALNGYVTNALYAFATGGAIRTDATTQVTGTVTTVQYAYKVTAISTETIGTAITTTASAVSVGDDTAQNACTLSGTTWFCPVILANGDGTVTVSIAKDGYVTKTDYAFATGGGSRALETTAQKSGTVTSVQYAYKITAISTETLGTDVSDTVSAVSVGDDTAQTACTLSGTTWFCPVILANGDGTVTVSIAKDGYVTKTDYAFATGGGSRAAATTAQKSGTVTSVQYAYKITAITSEAVEADLSAGTTALSIGDDTGVTACTQSGTTWFCPVALANSNGSIIATVTPPDGYVQKSTYTPTAGDTRTAATTAQVSDTIHNIQYGFKVSSIYDQFSNRLSTATVSTGDSYGTACTESVKAWYCIMPLANTGVVIKVVKDGYVTNTLVSFAADRTSITDAQQSISVTNVQFTNRPGGGYVPPAPSPSPSPTPNPTPVVPPVTVTPPIGVVPPVIESPSENQKTEQNKADEDKYRKLMLLDGKEFGVSLPAAVLDESAKFVTYGDTKATKDLGAGERRALLRDYLETTKFSDIKWDDVDRLAEGVKPVNRNLKLEQNRVASSLKIFTKIYGHAPNFKDPGEDLAWNTIMYRIRFPRDLVKETAGITKFKQLFKKTPTTPSDWATVRILGYIKK